LLAKPLLVLLNNSGESMKNNKKSNKDNQLYFTKFVPTLISLLALCFGLSAIRYGYSGNYILAATLILLAGFLDGIDGRIARFLNVSSDFGAQMDSLADAINFGVAPGFVVYCWKMNELELSGIAWFAVMLLACCMAIRLARFNVALTTKDQNDPLVKYFFTGIPAPAAACLVIFPMVLNFQFGYGFWSEPIFVVANTILIALLAASTVPTPCFKKIKISERYKNIVLIIATMFIILLVLRPWLALSVLGTAYIASIVLGIFVFLNFKKAKNKK
jgi:CDP-diacylglycerol--serine O-phosphatidyltransferase